MSKNIQDIIMGNQQERLFFDVGYLLGIIDGEGSYQIASGYKYKNYTIYRPRISIYNNNPYIIDKIADILNNLDIKHLKWQPKLHGRDKAIGYRIEVGGIKRIKRLTDFLLKFPSGKLERIKVLNDFCNYRILFKTNKRDGETYSEKVLEYKNKLNLLNSKYRGTESSETTRFDI